MWRDSKLIIFFLILALSSCKKEPVKVEGKDSFKKKAITRLVSFKQSEEEKFLYASHDKRDPLVPLVDKKGRPVAVVEGGIQFKISDLSLEGIIWDETKPLAIINDEVVGCGDKVSGVTVVKIEKDKVILNYQNETFELKME